MSVIQLGNHTLLVDDTDFCRSCGGKGYHLDNNPVTGGTIAETCPHCYGTGRKAVIMTKTFAS